jgi:hypothetical protein
MVNKVNRSNDIRTAIQTDIYNTFLLYAKKDGVRWICLTDIDAFVFPRDRWTLPEVLSTYSGKVGAIGISLLNFDHSNTLTWDKRLGLYQNLVVNRFTHRRHQLDPINGAIARSSTIYYVNRTISVGIHCPTKLVSGSTFVDVNGDTMPLTPFMHGMNTPAPHNGTIMLNHYYCKSKQKFELKNERNNLWESKAFTWQLRCNDSWNNGVYDDTIQRFLPLLKKCFTERRSGSDA